MRRRHSLWLWLLLPLRDPLGAIRTLRPLLLLLLLRRDLRRRRHLRWRLLLLLREARRTIRPLGLLLLLLLRRHHRWLLLLLREPRRTIRPLWLLLLLLLRRRHLRLRLLLLLLLREPRGTIRALRLLLLLRRNLRLLLLLLLEARLIGPATLARPIHQANWRLCGRLAALQAVIAAAVERTTRIASQLGLLPVESHGTRRGWPAGDHCTIHNCNGRCPANYRASAEHGSATRYDCSRSNYLAAA